MCALEVHQFFCLQDNFGVLVHDNETGLTASIDAPDATQVQHALKERGWSLTHILTTHHHHDHVGGNDALKAQTGCEIAGPAKEAERVPGIDTRLKEGDRFPFGGTTAEIIETPGHTAGHICYWFKDAGLAFTGDTLFSLGCGRLFECPAETMWASLQKLMALPQETIIHCGHEYTQSNGRFALSIEPGNEALQARMKAVDALRHDNKASLPTTLKDELETNPFLRPGSPEIRETLGMSDAADVDVFAEIRARKDRA